MSRAAKPSASQVTPAAEAPAQLHRKARPGVSIAREIAEMTAEGRAVNAVVTREWTVGLYAMPDQKPDITELVAAVEATGDRVADGDRADLERMLTSQAIALNTVFACLMVRAQHCKLMASFEAYSRLALRAQSQSRATVQTLAEMKMPTVFARQANIAGGHQQINNGMGDVARAGALEAEPNKLLEAPHGERLDPGTATATAGGDQVLAPVGTLHRPAHRKG